MSNDFYNHDNGYPAQSAIGASAPMRAEFDLVAGAFEKMPDLTGNAGKIVLVKVDETGLTVVGVLGTGDVVLASGTTGTGKVVREGDPTFVLTDLTTNDASTAQHGWMKKLPGNAAVFYNGNGAFTAPPSQSMIPDSRSTNIILSGADNGHLIRITSGTFTQTVTAAATLGSGWSVLYQNFGTGDITVDPNGAETINGAATLLIQPGASYYIVSDGTNLLAVVVRPSTGYMKVSDQKASGTSAGSSIASDITQTRTFNTVEANTINGASLAANAVTLPTGTYLAKGSAPARAGRHRVHLYNSTDATYPAIGSGAATNDIISDFFCQITITTSKAFTMRHWTLTASASDGLGVAIGTGLAESFSQMEFYKVA